MHSAKNMNESGLVKEMVWTSWKREKYLETLPGVKAKILGHQAHNVITILIMPY
jgi:hypothetical protein